MNRRTFITTLAAAPIVLLAACGDDASGDRPDVDTTVPPTTAPPTTVPSISHPTGAQDVVLRLAWEGGFVAPDAIFVRLPRVLVAGDGSIYTQGAQIEIYPQPLLPPVLVGTMSEEKLQEILRLARDANLFRDVTYATNNMVADAPDTVLQLTVDGRTYVHRAYALGMGGDETDADRAALAKFVAALEPVMAADFGAAPYVPTRYAIRATPADQAPPPADVQPNEVDWPAASGVKLAEAAECAVVDAATVQDLFTAATQITRFVDGGAKYVLVVRPMLPGDTGCAG